MKLNLGCSSAHHPGYVNVDRVQPADLIVDLSKSWPWFDSSIEGILAIDVIEHLPNKIHTLNEMYRVLMPDAIAEIEVPPTTSPVAFADPTHVSYWNRMTFNYFDVNHPVSSTLATAYGITARFRVVEEYLRTMREGPKLLIKLAAVK